MLTQDDIMRVVCLSDTHGDFEKVTVPDGDLLIHCGDATNVGSTRETKDFLLWFVSHPHKYKVFIAGNHDMFWDSDDDRSFKFGENMTYLQNKSLEIEGLKLYGTPVIPLLARWAFEEPPSERQKIFAQIPYDLDILISHVPPMGILDWNQIYEIEYGCPFMRSEVEKKKPKFHVFGHIHEQGGRRLTTEHTEFINCSVMDEAYQVVRQPMVFEI